MPGQTRRVVLVGDRRRLFGSVLRLRLIGRLPLLLACSLSPFMFQRLDVIDDIARTFSCPEASRGTRVCPLKSSPGSRCSLDAAALVAFTGLIPTARPERGLTAIAPFSGPLTNPV